MTIRDVKYEFKQKLAAAGRELEKEDFAMVALLSTLRHVANRLQSKSQRQDFALKCASETAIDLQNPLLIDGFERSVLGTTRLH